MINDVNESIKQLLTKKGQIDSGVIDIAFETPDREWSASISKPTINIYLYDIRENHRLRGSEWIINKDENGYASKKKNASRIDVAYLITVWTKEVMDEHRLLWNILSVLFHYSELPDDVLTSELAALGLPIKTTTAQPDGLFNNPADFWAALDNKIKPSLNYIVTLPLDTHIELTAPTVKSQVFDFHSHDSKSEKVVRVAGYVYEIGKPGVGVKQARVSVKETGTMVMTDSHGFYTLIGLSEGKYTFQVGATGKRPKEKSVIIPAINYNLEI
jgi:hypothetical protein